MFGLFVLDGVTDSESDSDPTTTTSSTEHLTQEEKRLYVLRQTPRQEPQGQESRSCRSSSRSRSGSRSESRSRSDKNRVLHQSNGAQNGSSSRLLTPDKASSSCRTLIIHGSLSDESWTRFSTKPSIFVQIHMPCSSYTTAFTRRLLIN